MKALLIGAAMLAFAGEASAQAPATACEGLKQLLSVNADTIKGLRGAVVKLESDKIAYASKLQIPGFTNCKVTSYAKKGVTGFFEHDFECEAELANSEAGSRFTETSYACLKDLVRERTPTETLLGGAYRITEFDAKVSPKGKAADMGYDQEYLRVNVGKNFADSETVSVHAYYYFAKQ